MEAVSDPDNPLDFDYDKERKTFNETFKILASTLSQKAFGFPNKKKDRITKGFGVYHFEAMTIGIQPFLGKLDISTEPNRLAVLNELTAIKLDPGFIEMTTGGGKNSKGPLKDRIQFVENKLSLLK
jgi:hypothetical protein